MAGQIAQDIQGFINRANFTGDAGGDAKGVHNVRAIVLQTLPLSRHVEFLTALLDSKKSVMDVKAKGQLENMLRLAELHMSRLAELPADVRKALLSVKFDGRTDKETNDRLEVDRIHIIVLRKVKKEHRLQFLKAVRDREQYGMRDAKHEDAKKVLLELYNKELGAFAGPAHDDGDYVVMGDDETGGGGQAIENSISIFGRRGRGPSRQAHYEQLKQYAEDLEEENKNKEKEIMKLRAKIRALKAGSTVRRHEQISRQQKSNAVIWV